MGAMQSALSEGLNVCRWEAVGCDPCAALASDWEDVVQTDDSGEPASDYSGNSILWHRSEPLDASDPEHQELARIWYEGD